MTSTPTPNPDAATAARHVADLVALMKLEATGEDRFRGQSENIGTPAVFGGQVLAQSLVAASLTVPDDRPVHSMHAYFLLPGQHAPIDYTVHRARDGRSFTTRHVIAKQEGREIFEMAASFQTRDEGIDHQDAMPDAPDPLSQPSELERRIALGDRVPEQFRFRGLISPGLDVRVVNAPDLVKPTPSAPRSMIWMRAIAPLPDDPLVHRALLAYASDNGLLRAAMNPHALTFFSNNLRVASLDHAMWFHRDFRMDEWLLYVIDSPSAGGARGLCRGSIFTRDGRLVASTAQEGMLRVLKD
ncbi:acyl-CoA thioesterase II [Variovorax dokdonensis]|uniref:Acyl-CoA thioesterase II n=1 Tax=Variovorax dokdonensis TaxID=344883 RepID=A0ABT7NA20_9BURK|nr:acyl-CoA thioesterase II [Variovorax dokdonensis]MDM0044763.1 acyl-CoA thioesterase II [Variovorax dokdonensis]